MRRLTPRRTDDRGASLALVMIVVIGLSLVSASLLTYSATAIRSAKQTAQASQTASDIGGALQAAINDVRNSDYFNNTALAQACLNGGTKSYPDSVDTANPTFVVSCAPDPGSGAAGGLVPVNNTNKPSLALLTLGGAGEPGLQKNGNSVLSIKGSVYSNSSIATANGTDCPLTPQPPAAGANCNEVYVIGASVTAEGACTGRIIATGTPGLSCSTNTHVSAGDDPANTYPAGYVMPTSGMTPQTLPSCSTNPVTFTPGYYDDAQGLSALFANSGPCAGKTRWFQPGTYYFDFHNEEMPAGGGTVVPRDLNPGNKWVVDDPNGIIVGGTKKGWTTAATDVPNACVSPLESTSNPGVMFVFGGNSQFLMQRGQMEICGTWYTNKPPIAVYGAKTLAGDPEQTPTLLPSAVTSTGNPASYSTTASALANGSDGDAGPTVNNVQKNKTVTLDVTSFNGLSAAIPARAYLASAVLTVRHAEQGANAGTTLVAKVKVNNGNATVASRNLTVNTAPGLVWRTETFNLTSDLANQLYAYGGSPASLPFTTSVQLDTDSANGQQVTSRLDLLKLDLTFRPIAVRAQSGCVTTVGAGGCAQFATNSTPGKELYIQGTAYLPRAQIDVTLNNISGQVFRSGLVARSALLSITSSSSYSGPVIELPDNTLAPTPLAMFFTVWKCPSGFSGAPSTAGGCTVRGRAKVTYTDGSFTPTPGQRGVTINSWTVGR